MYVIMYTFIDVIMDVDKYVITSINMYIFKALFVDFF
jgi:hypothetical protein